jgi:hypothetical protein
LYATLPTDRVQAVLTAEEYAALKVVASTYVEATRPELVSPADDLVGVALALAGAPVTDEQRAVIQAREGVRT